MEKRSKIKTMLVVAFTVAIVFGAMTLFPVDNRKWTVLGAQVVDDPELGENSGICGFYIFDTGSTYTANLTSGTSGYVSGGNQTNATNFDMKHTVGQDLILWARFNNTDSGLDVQYVRGNLTWTGNITGTTAPDHTYVTNTSAAFIFVNFVWDNADAGYTIERNQKNIAIDDITIKGYK